MADRVLKIDIIVEADGSITKLKSLDDAMNRLSDRSLAKVSAGVSTVDKELASLQRELDKTASASGRAEKSTGAFDAASRKLIATLSGLISAGAIIGAVKNTLAYADALEDAAKQTGINVVEYQKLAFAAKQNNVEFQRLTGSINVMQDRLAGGDKSAHAALLKMNTSWAELKKLAPDKQLIAISDGIKTVVSHEDKVAVLNDLFGRQGRELLPLLTSNMRAYMQAAEDTAQVLDAETIKALADANDAIDQMKTSGLVLIGSVLRPMVPALKGVTDQVLALAGAWNRVISGQANFGRIGQFIFEAAKTGSGGGLLSLMTPQGVAQMINAASATGSPLTSSRMGDISLDPAEAFVSEADAAKARAKADREASRETEKLARETAKAARAFADVTSDIRKFETVIDGRATPFGTPVEGWDPSMENPALDALIRWNALMGQQGAAARGGHESKFIGGVPVGIELNLDAAMAREEQGVAEAGVRMGRTFGDAFRDTLGAMAPQLMADFADALMGRGPHPSRAGNLAANLAQTATQILGDMVLPGLGQVLAPIVGDLLYKPSMRANDMRDQFIAQAGGVDALNRRAVEAGGSLNWLLRADDPDELLKAIEALTRQIEEAEQQRREDIRTLLSEKGLADPSTIAAIAGRQGFLGGDAERQALEQFLMSNLGKAAGGFQSFLQAGGQVTAGNAAGFGSGVAAVFGELVGSGAASPLEALKALGPVIADLQAQFSKLGVDGGAAFADISSLATFAADEGVATAINQVLALNDVMVGLQNTGLLTEETFDALTGTIADTFNKLVAEGKNGDQALRLMQPSLQTIWELQQDFGFSVDETTQKLLDQAAAQGLVGDQFRSAEERMTKALEKLIERLDRFIAAFEGVGDAAQQAADDANAALRGIEFPEFPERYEDPGGGQEGESGGSGEYWRGGLVRPRYLAIGGPSGTDTVPAWLTPGEFVMRRSAVERIGVGTLQAMNSGGGAATVNHYHTWNVLDGESVKRVVEGREFADAFVNAQAKNANQIRTRTRATLGVVS